MCIYSILYIYSVRIHCISEIPAGVMLIGLTMIRLSGGLGNQTATGRGMFTNKENKQWPLPPASLKTVPTYFTQKFKIIDQIHLPLVSFKTTILDTVQRGMNLVNPGIHAYYISSWYIFNISWHIFSILLLPDLTAVETEGWPYILVSAEPSEQPNDLHLPPDLFMPESDLRSAS